VTRIAISLALLIFFSFSSLASVERIAPGFEAESQTSLWTDDKDPSIETNRGRRVLKRYQRGKSSLKSLPKLDKPPSKGFLFGWTRHASFVSHVSKSSVYQQINVYRI
jgi:hypothetical protein